MITLYHGSNVEIDHICLEKCNPYKDFGRGFYLTDIYDQAKQMAHRRTRIAGEGKPIVTSYEFNEDLLVDKSLNVKIFDEPSKVYRSAEKVQPGIWYIMPTQNMDHLEFSGGMLNISWSKIRSFYLQYLKIVTTAGM